MWPFLTAAPGDQCMPPQAPETPVFTALREPREGTVRPAVSAVAGCSTDQPVTMPGWGQRQPGDGCACPGIRVSGTEDRRGPAGSSAESEICWFRVSWQLGPGWAPGSTRGNAGSSPPLRQVSSSRQGTVDRSGPGAGGEGMEGANSRGATASNTRCGEASGKGVFLSLELT